MSDPYERAKGGRLAFKGGSLATRSKTIDKNKKKKKKKKTTNPNDDETEPSLNLEELEAAAVGDATETGEGFRGGEYTIDAAKRKKYDDLFPVEARKFGYDPKAKTKSVEEALDDRVKKKADRYCK